MTTSAIIMIVLTQGIVLAATIYFFWKVLKSPAKPEPDSFSENDNDPR
jgi:heme/copper-type cytochrome/quinol oxidase subunit 2